MPWAAGPDEYVQVVDSLLEYAVTLPEVEKGLARLNGPTVGKLRDLARSDEHWWDVIGPADPARQEYNRLTERLGGLRRWSWYWYPVIVIAAILWFGCILAFIVSSPIGLAAVLHDHAFPDSLLWTWVVAVGIPLAGVGLAFLFDEVDFEIPLVVLGLAAAAIILAAAPYLGWHWTHDWTGILIGIGVDLVIGLAFWGLIMFDEKTGVIDDVFDLPSVVFAQAAGVPRQARAAFDTWRLTLLEQGVLPFIRSEINKRFQRQYSSRLEIFDAPGLRDAGRHDLHITTPAGQELAGLLLSQSGGSFALSGPRGSGKSNLLRAICRGEYTITSQHPDLSVQISAPVAYDSREFMQYLYLRLCDAVLAYGWQRTGSPGGLLRPAQPPVYRLREQAASTREQLRNQLTWTTEVAGKVTGGVGEVSGKRALAKAGRALTYPELVDDLRRFLALVVEVLRQDVPEDGSTRAGRVIVAIDELDRIAERDQAYRFLNEIKAIFDIEHCYFLVSVSDEALHDLELAGAGMRSAFDSAFDELIRVEYLDLPLAKQLLRKYVIGLSEQYLALIYVLAGGRARGLIRSARVLFKHSDSPRAPKLSTVVPSIAATELSAACRAGRDLVADQDDADRSVALLRALDEYPRDPLTEEALRAYAGRLLHLPGSPGRSVSVRERVAARAYFLATVIGVFGDELGEPEIELLASGSDDGGASFHTLSRIRSYLGTNPILAIELLNDFRAAWTTDSGGAVRNTAPRPRRRRSATPPR
ncbi:hypothetical protein D5S17_05990 [Pseudonocardiaceae bacterium YIM PH 21723]|nr:hypothetical protein D5S17_05990 [Pseudonocardiaceae bacterium YIM PH 21723]